jgi:hypothetical protein
VAKWVDRDKERRDSERERAQYDRAIALWIARNFPDLVSFPKRRSPLLPSPVPVPHPAAELTVRRLHYANGRGSVTVKEHGELIRRQVREWDKRCEELDATWVGK